MPSHIVAIIGRPNVGKSTLFNRILGLREAIVHDTPGVTRDRKYGEAEWVGKHFTIIDTGGYVPASDDVFERAIREQAAVAIEEADSIVFVVDAMEGITPLDKEIANILRQSNKPVLLTVNKVDSAKREAYMAEFYALGLGDPVGISALGGRDVGDFLDRVTGEIRKPARQARATRLRIAIVGKPNVGKSSLVNALLGKQRQVVTPIAGTTRDPVDSILHYQGEEIVLVDTAGLRKRSRITESVEFFSTLRTLRSLEHSDIAIVLMDAVQGVDKQDLQIVEAAMQRFRPVIIAVNKWDLVEKETNTSRDYESVIQKKLGVYDFIPVVFISALTKQRIARVVDLAKKMHAEQARRISTSALNNTLIPEIQRTPPRSSSPKEIKIKYVTQVKSTPPMFAFFCNEPTLVQESYRRYLDHRIRAHFGFDGIPLRIVFKKK